MPKKLSCKLQRAHEKHAEFLSKYGIDHSKRPKLKGVDREKYSQPKRVTSDSIPGSGAKKFGHGPGNRIIGQAYNKGPLMVLSSKDELGNAKRRDR